MTRTSRIVIGAGAGVVFLVAAAAAVPMLLSDGADYSKVASIARTPAYQDPALLAKAFALPVARLYQPGLDFQGNGSFCGPTTIVNVLRSLGLDGQQATVLEGSGIRTFFGILPGGLTLDQLAQLARKRLGRNVTALHDLDLAGFREELRHANDPARRYTINFHRGPLFGRGGGHHSPIAGYLEAEDLVLVLDVNRQFKPWLVSSERLFEAMSTFDKVAGRKRGLQRIE